MKNPKDRVIISILLFAIIFIIYSIAVYSASEFSVSARSAALYEPTTDSFLFEKNADTRLPMASTTKIMTALLAIENSPLDSEVKISDEAIGVEGSSLYLKKGETLLMKDLIYGLMLRSANDAAAAIAYEISGGIEAFSVKMNERAEELGLKNTHFTNPHGLDDPEHYTTAKDLAKLSAEALRNDTFKKIVGTKKITIKNSLGETRLITNHNKLLSLYDTAIGVKTGFTKKSGRCLVGASEYDGITLVSVTIDAPDDWNDHIKMLDFGHSRVISTVLAEENEFTYALPVIGSNEKLIVTNRDALKVVSKKYDATIEKQVILDKYIIAPIKKDDVIGEVVFMKNNKIIGKIALYAENNVN